MMENLKVKVNNEVESKEAQELFFELGGDFHFGGKLYCNNHLNLVTINKYGLMANIELDGFDYAEITIPQLRDMVVLKRNNVGDATHTDQDNWSWFISSDGVGYVFGAGNASGLHQWDEASLEMVDLKPIQNNDLPFIDSEESLNDKIASAEAARQEMKADNVNNPSHYNKGGIECIEAIKASMTHEAFCGYLKGNVQKYMWRYEVKGGVESLQKAQWYLNKLIECES